MTWTRIRGVLSLALAAGFLLALLPSATVGADPLTGTWALTGSMVSPRSGATATLLNDGEVLVTGGCLPYPVGPRGCHAAETYHPTTGKWITEVNTVTYRTGGQTATLLQDGRVLVAGG